MATDPSARAPKGTVDMLPATARVWEHLLRTAEDLFALYGYEPIYTPIFEHTDVFVRGIGEATDIVGKEMYTFEDKGGRSITLRPEGTASVVRAALEHSLTANGQSTKLYYAGPMFRYERPQVAAFIREHAGVLCEECDRRADTNPLRAFDCKNEACREVMSGAPLLRDELCEPCATHYAAVKAYLDHLGIAYEEDPSLVRGLDYYTRTVFEIQAEGLGAQKAIGGGGRYDRLMQEYGGPPTPGLGFALGFERTVLALAAAGVEVPVPAVAEVFVARAVAEVAGDAFLICDALRCSGIAAETDHQARSLKSQFKLADRLGARYVVLVGPDELANGQVTLRDMATSNEERVEINDLAEIVLDRLGR